MSDPEVRDKNIEYAIDATVLIDNFEGKANVRSWLHGVIESETTILTTPTIVIEFARYLRFAKNLETSRLKQIVFTLSRTFSGFKITRQDSSDVFSVCQELKRIDTQLNCHTGELTLLPILRNPFVTFVSSDINALRAFINSNRLDPRASPAQFYGMGKDASMVQ